MLSAFVQRERSANNFELIMNDSLNQIKECVDSIVPYPNIAGFHDVLNQRIMDLEQHIQDTKQLLLVLIIISILLSALFFYLLFKRFEKLNKRWRKTNNVLNDISDRLFKVETNCEDIKRNISDTYSFVSERFKFLNSDNNQIQSKNTGKNNTSNGKNERNNRKKEIFYSSIQEPDREGKLRIAERSMTDVSSPRKWFIVEFREGDNYGTYTINPDAKSEMIEQLESLQYFVNPFSLNSTPKDIIVVREGTIEKEEKFWIVKEKATIKFK